MNVLHVVPRLGASQGGLRSAVLGLRSALVQAGASCTIATVECELGDDVLCFRRSRPLLTWNSRELAGWLDGHARDYDAVIAHSMWFTPSRLAFAAAARADVPFWLHPHGMLDPDALEHHRWRKLVRWTTGDRRIVQNSRLLFSNEAERDRAARRARFDPGRADVVANPVPAALFDLKRRTSGPPRVLCLNRLHPRKGVLEWVQALRLLDERGVDFRASHAGARENAHYAARVEAAANPLVARGKLELLPPSDRVGDMLAQADIVVHPATGYENFGMVAAEALAAGAAVMCSPRALVCLQLAAANAAVVAEPTPHALADAMAGLLAESAAREAMAARGRQYAREHFSPDVVGSRLLEILRARTGWPPVRKKIILFELNEVPFRVVDEFVRAHPKSALAAMLAQGVQYETITPDRSSLSPWKTWPTLHRGVNDEKHLIQDFGQDLAEVDRAYPPLWRLLVDAGVKVGLCGSLHSYPPPQSYEGYSFYLPDTFAAGSECFPSALARFQGFNLAMARDSARNVSRRVPWRDALGLLAGAPGLGLKASTLARIGGQLISERVQSWKSTRRRSYQSVLAFDVFMKQLEKSRPDFATFFTNHVASSQHRYWAAAFPGDYADYGYSDDWRSTYADEIDYTMRKADAMLKRLRRFARANGYVIWIASSMGQAATKAEPFETQLYLVEPGKFMAALGFAAGEHERRPAMLPQVNVVVRRVADFRAALAGVRIDGKPLGWREAAGGHFSLDFGHENLHGKPEFAQVRGVDIPFADLGLVNVEIDDKSGTSAYHVPGGILLVCDPARDAAAGSTSRPQIQSTEIAPSLLRHFAAAIPGYMPKPAALGE